MLGKKQNISNDDWIKAISTIEDAISKSELDNIIDKTIDDIKSATKDKAAAYAWSGGKDSIVLGKICELADVRNSVIGICDLEYPAFMKWIEKNKPDNCTIINTHQNLEWLSKHQEMLFPRESKIAAKWFSIVQHRAQNEYFRNSNLDILLLGRRRADGNYTGVNNTYTTAKGITRYSPLADWKHEHILAFLHYYNVELPPIYGWENGYKCGTHPWAARQWTVDISDGWRQVYGIDKSIVEEASEYIDSAKAFLKEVSG